jgi:autotransporter translocation and assembly factor TamB
MAPHFSAVLKRYGIWLVVLVAIAIGALTLLDRYSADLLKLGLNKAMQASQGRLTMSEPVLAPGGGLSVDTMRWKDDERDVAITSLKLKPAIGLDSLLGRNVELSSIAAEKVEVFIAPSKTPFQLPADLGLPVSVFVRSATVKKLVIKETADKEFLSLRDVSLSGVYKRDAGRYELSQLSFENEVIKYQGKVSMKDKPPFAFSSDGNFKTSIPSPDNKPNAAWPIQLAIQSEGSLESHNAKAMGTFRELKVSGSAVVAPFKAALLSDVKIRAEGFDLAKWLPNLKGMPSTNAAIDYSASPLLTKEGTQEFLAWSGDATMVNQSLGKVDDAKLPFNRISGLLAFDLREGSQQFSWSKLQGQLPNVAEPVVGQLQWQPAAFTSHLEIKDANAALFFNGAPKTVLTGAIDVVDSLINYRLVQGSSELVLEGKAQNQAGTWLLSGGGLSLPKVAQTVSWNGSVSPSKDFKVEADLTKVDASLWLDQFKKLQLEFMPDLNSMASQLEKLKAVFGGKNTALLLDGKLNASAILGNVSAPYELVFASRASVLGTDALTGKIAAGVTPSSSKDKASSKPFDRLKLDAQLGWRGAALVAQGGLGSEGNELVLEGTSTSVNSLLKEYWVNRPNRLEGGATATLNLSGDPNQPNFTLNLKSNKLAFGSTAKTLFEANDFAAKVNGTLANTSGAWVSDHAIEAGFSELGQKVSLKAAGIFNTATSRWQGTLNELAAAGKYDIKLVQALGLDIAPDRVSTGKATLNVDGGSFELNKLVYSDELVELNAQTSNLPIERLLYWAQAKLPAALQKIAGWRVSANVTVKGRALENLTGFADVVLEGEGVLPSQGRLLVTDGRLSGGFNVALGSFASLSQPLGPEWFVDGALSAKVLVSGQITTPVFNADITGSKLLLEQKSLGWKMRDGVVTARVNADGVVIDSMSFNVGAGSLKASGQHRFNASGASQFALVADKVSLPLSPEQRIVLSGTTQVLVQPKSVLWSGRLTADDGLIELRSATASADPNDVVIYRDRDGKVVNAPAKPTSAGSAGSAPSQFTIGADLQLDLGQKIRVIGTGVEARLQGVLSLKGNLPDAPRVVGTVNTVNGTYVAYGQKLEIDRGRLIFSGPFDNPTLDIVALRKRQPVEAGVSLAGTALNPKIKLISVPDVPDSEKLSWLVLGVGIENNRDNVQNAALGAAAATLLGEGGSVSNSVAKTLGLDVLSLRSATTTAGGAPVASQGLSSVLTTPALSSAQQNVVTVGKRLSSRLYVSYEQGLKGVWNLLRIQYDISNRLSLRAHAGSESAVDLLLFHPFD